MLNIVICDDTPVQLQYTHKLVSSYFSGKNITLFDFGSAEDLLSHISGGLLPHIAILDIELGTANGISLAKELNALCPGCQIIFLTAYSQYASDVYYAKHAWFVIKKDIEKYLPSALEKATSSAKTGMFEEEPWLLVKIRHTQQRIPVSSILYLERITYRTRIVTVNKEIVCGQAPKELLEHLPNDLFIRCHQSYWINMGKIFSQKANEFHLIDGTAIPISRTYKKSALEAFRLYAAQ